jgi:hypothetical protein
MLMGYSNNSLLYMFFFVQFITIYGQNKLKLTTSKCHAFLQLLHIVIISTTPFAVKIKAKPNLFYVHAFSVFICNFLEKFFYRRCIKLSQTSLDTQLSQDLSI